jgi:hypothetical protein
MFYDYTGSGAPTITPLALNQFYQNTTDKDVYVSTGTSSSSDWSLLLTTGYRIPLIIAHYISNFTITNEDIVKTDGSNIINATLPSASGFTRTLTFKHRGTQDMTILGTIDGDPTGLILRGGHKNAATIFSNGIDWETV